MRHLFVVDSLDKHIQNEKELIRPRRLLPAARATRARSAQFYVVLIRHDSTGVGGLFCICVESINLNLNLNRPPFSYRREWDGFRKGVDLAENHLFLGTAFRK